MMAEPPVLAGGLKVTEAWPVPAVAVPMVGAAGTTALTLKVWLTVCAAAKLGFPAWSALIVQFPAVTKGKAPPDVIVHTPVVEEVKVTAALDVAVAVNVGLVPKACVPGSAKVIVWLATGVTALDTAEAGPVPAPLVAVTVKA
jgi:hypothetical protein